MERYIKITWNENNNEIELDVHKVTPNEQIKAITILLEETNKDVWQMVRKILTDAEIEHNKKKGNYHE